MLGASTRSVVWLHTQLFTVLVVLANLLIAPVTYLAKERWLQNFTYRVDVEPWIFLIGGALTLLLTWLTLGYRTIKAGRMNPVEMLRYAYEAGAEG